VFLTQLSGKIYVLFALNHWLLMQLLSVVNAVVKGKAIPLQAWTGPEVSRRFRLPDFKTIGT
jgi:hypothetical protein